MSAALALSVFGAAVASAVVPVVNAELLVVGIALTQPASAATAVLAVALGQMVGKSALFLSGGRFARCALAPRLARWGLDRGARGQVPLRATSAAVGLPPFYLMAVAAPTLGIRFRTFALVGLAGRIVRFTALVGAPALLSALLH